MSNLEKKKRYREKIGQVFQVPLGDGTFAYGQLVHTASKAFFDYRDDGQNPNLEEIIKKPVIFIIAVDYYVFKNEIWKILGGLPVDSKFKKMIDSDDFGWDPFAKRYFIFKNGVGQVPATLEEIQGLECMASWGHGSVEQRLRDHFAGRPNYDYVSDRNQHDSDFPDRKTFYKQYGYDFTLLDDE